MLHGEAARVTRKNATIAPPAHRRLGGYDGFEARSDAATQCVFATDSGDAGGLSVRLEAMSTPSTEADLQRDRIDGSPEALGRVFDSVASGLLCVASQLSPGDEEDVLQETSVTLIERRPEGIYSGRGGTR